MTLLIYHIILFAIFACVFCFFKFKKQKSLLASILYGLAVWFVGGIIITLIYGSIRENSLTAEEKREIAIKDSIEKVKKDSISNAKKIQEANHDKIRYIQSTAKAYLLSQLNDPDSYEEVGISTNIVDSVKDIYNVKISFRAKNAFNAKVLQTYDFTVAYKGKQSTVIEVKKH